MKVGEFFLLGSLIVFAGRTGECEKCAAGWHVNQNGYTLRILIATVYTYTLHCDNACLGDFLQEHTKFCRIRRNFL